jgi:hypothetical protein
MQSQARTCAKCVLKSTTPGVAINEEGICSDCARHDKHPGYDLERLSREMEDRLAELEKESMPYHALVRFSGGKDSVCLLYLIKNKYKLRPLAFTVVHPFLNNLASSNVDNVARKLGVDLLKFYPDESMFTKFLRYGLLEGSKYGLKEDVGCDLCSYVYHWVSYRMAMRMNIPYLFDGVDAAEHEKPIFIDGEAMKMAMQSGVKYQDPVPDIFRDACGDEYRGSIYDQDINYFANEEFPTTMSPFTFIPYDYKKDIEGMAQVGIIARQETLAGVQTNCEARHLFSYIAFKRYDCHPWVRQLARGLRRGYPTHIEQWGIGGVENLTREDILGWLDDYKKGLYFIADNEASGRDVKEALREMLPNMVRIQGEQGFSVMITQMLEMPRYADYIGVDLGEFSKHIAQIGVHGVTCDADL